ncbi:hypothetical protein IFR05_010031 [Cadophora sp. M221]|nr:hypothetical protein IFR05_010031 [Cadophora sp. M221]
MGEFYYLYDLPLDIISCLLDNVVETIGIAETARLRLVCKLFDREIPGAIYRSPEFESSTSSDTPSLELVIRDYVLYRTLADGKCKQNLSARLHRILEIVLPDERSDGEEYQTALQTLVATVVGQNFYFEGSLRLMNCSRNNSLLDSTFRSDCLKAAARLGISQMFEEIVFDASRDGGQSKTKGSAFGESSLVFAAMGGQHSLAATILDSREAAGCKTYNEELGYAIRGAILEGHEDIIHLLLQPKYGYVERSLQIPAVAASVNRFDIFRLLCERLQVPLDGLRYLTEAAKYGHLDFVKLCLANGADVNANTIRLPDMWELESPLHAAASRGYRKVVQFLLASGANPTDILLNQQPLTGAARAGHHEIVADLLSAGAVPVHHYRWSPLIAACTNGQVMAAKVLLDSGVELWYKDRSLSIAARGGYESLVRLLVSRGARVDGPATPTLDDLDPPMLEAMKFGHGNVVRLLRELGAKDVDLPQDS